MIGGNEIKLILNAVDNASREIKMITGEIGRMGDQVTAEDRAMAASLKTQAMWAAGLAAAGVVLKKVYDFTKQAVEETVTYNKTIREMTQVTGLASEEISRIVQVGDDWGISIEAIRTSLSFMNKTGVTPSIDNLAKLADEYVATADKSAFAEKAVKVLGRGYQTLIPLLALGGQGFRDAAAGIDKNLIATDDSIAASRKYEVAMDDLNDAVTAFKYELANGLIPTLVDLLNILNDINKSQSGEVDLIDSLKAAQKAGLITWAEMNQAVYDLGNNTKTTAEITEKYKSELDELSRIEAYGIQVERQDAIQRRKLDGVTEDLVDTTGKLGRGMSLLKGALEDTEWAESQLKLETEKTKKALDALNESFGEFSASVGGPVGTEIDNFNDSQDELREKMAGIKDEIALAISQGYSPLGSKILELQGQYDELAGQYGENATAHEAATRRILYDIMVEKVAAADLTVDEREKAQAMLTSIAEGWGLVDKNTQFARGSVDHFLALLQGGDAAAAFDYLDSMDEQWLDNGQDIATATANAETLLHTIKLIPSEVDAINAALDKMPKRYQIDVDLVYNPGQMPPLPGSAPIINATGANYVVPPGHNNETWNLGTASSGEHVVITPKGGDTTNNFSMSVHTNAPYSTLLNDYNIMKAMAG